MKANHLTMQELMKFGLILMVGISMCACSKTTWKEEVLLHDGSKIVVERTVSRGGRHEIGQLPPIEEQTMTFHLDERHKQVTWKSEFSKDVGLAELMPLAIDIHKGIAYVVAVPVGCLSYNKWARPNPPYVVFRYDGNDWKHIALVELPTDLVSPNLIFSSPDEEVKQAGNVPVVSAETTKAVIASYDQPEYKTILREPLIKQGPEGCREEIYNGHGTWLSRDWFTSQTSYEACINFCKTEDFSDQVCPCNSIFKRK